MMAIYRYSNEYGQERILDTTSEFIATLFLGPFYLIYKKLWFHVFIFFFLWAVLGEGVSIVWLIYPFLIKGILIKHYLKKDYDLEDI